MDLYNNEILTYSITSGCPKLDFVLKPLDELLSNLPKANTGQGWKYRHKLWQKCRQAHVTPSMSRRATCLDNACIEKIFNKMKVEIGNLKQYHSPESLIQAIKTWIKYYN